MDNLIPIENSSNMTGYYYQPDVQHLFIQFKNSGMYRYDLVPAAVMNEFEAAPSKGGFFARHIKDKFACVKLKVEDSENNACS